MTPQPAQLEALVAIADQGSFEAAAKALHVTASAVSQRIRALESMAGQVLVSRTTPCRPTDAGAAYVRLGRQTRLLYDEARLAVDDTDHVVGLAVAVNADSLATWFRDVLSAAADWDGIALRLRVEDQAYTAGLLRSGDVLAAVTSEPSAVQGCAVEPLGVLRYGAAAAPAFVERWRARSRTAWTGSGCRSWCSTRRTRSSTRYWPARGVTARTVHQVPTSTDFHEAARRGLGWCLVPEPQLLPDLAAGTLVRLPGRDSANRVDVPLFWQRWRLDSPALARLTRGRPRRRPRPPAALGAPPSCRQAAATMDRVDRVAGGVAHGGQSPHRVGSWTSEAMGRAVPHDLQTARHSTQKADSSRSMIARLVAWAIATSALTFGSTSPAKNCAAATLPS